MGKTRGLPVEGTVEVALFLRQEKTSSVPLFFASGEVGSMIDRGWHFTHRRIVFAILAWSALIGGLAVWNQVHSAATLSEMAYLYARASQEKDVLYRRWNACHGGVCAPISKDTPPNPGSKVGDREAAAAAGRPLTLTDPAYMIRQVYELAANANESTAHITSLKPINPKNAPDEWERQGLLAFEKGAREASVILHENGSHRIRLMRPFYVEDSCLNCHAQQGCKVGDVRGAISVSLPLDAVWKAGEEQARTVFIALAIIWLLGGVAIVSIGALAIKQQRQRTRMHEALRRADFCLEQAGEGILWLDLQGNIVFANRRVCQATEYSREELQAKSVFDISPTITKELWDFHWEKIRTRRSFSVEICNCTKSGRVYPVEASVNHMLFDGKEYSCAFVRDISDRKAAEARLAHFSAIVGSSQDAIYASTLDGVVTSWNPGAERLYGYTEDEMVGNAISLLAPPDRPDEIAGFLRRVACGERVEIDTVRRKKDGAPINVFLTWSAIKNNEGAIVGAACIAHDISHRKQAERSLREANQRLLEDACEKADVANRAKSEFLANMSHEIRTPMTAILGFTDILLGSAQSEESAEWARIIKQNGEHLLGLINDILDLSKIEAGKCTVDLQKCTPRKIAGEVVSLMKVRADAKGLSLTLHVLGNVPEIVTTDPIRLRQILVNLVGNAVKFTDAGGVRVVMQYAPESTTEGKLIFDVIDTGIGMSKDQMDLLFRPFSQVDGSATRRFGGTGLGLAISKRMAEMLGGDITVDSIPGHGSVFSLSIQSGETAPSPVELPGEPVVAAKDASNCRLNFACRILLAEDGPDNQRLIALVLRRAGAEVEVAENGQIALERALAAEQSGKPFDIILMDMQMPVMDGYLATRRLRETGCLRPIIALTANAMSGDDAKCIDAGCDAYIAKPIDVKNFVGLLRPWMSKPPSTLQAAGSR